MPDDVAVALSLVYIATDFSPSNLIVPWLSIFVFIPVPTSAFASSTVPFIIPVEVLVIFAPLLACSPLVPTVIAVAFCILPLFPDTNTFKKLILGTVPALKSNFPSCK